MLNVYSLRLGADVHKDAPILYVGQDRKYYFLFLRKVRMFMIILRIFNLYLIILKLSLGLALVIQKNF